jgi:hypothetical protein
MKGTQSGKVAEEELNKLNGLNELNWKPGGFVQGAETQMDRRTEGLRDS